MTPRERFLHTVSHTEADRVPLDLGGCSLTSISSEVLLDLRQILGIPANGSPNGGLVDERILKALDVDFRPVGRLIGSGDRTVSRRSKVRVDIWGIERTWTGQYWEITHSPLAGSSLEDLDAYPWPDPSRIVATSPLEIYREDARHLWEETEYVVVGEHPVYGIFELACWMCGFGDFLWRLAGDLPFVHRLFQILLDLQKQFIEPYYQALGPYIHLTTSGDDFGMQNGPFMAPSTFRELIKPYFAERIAYTRQFTQAHFWHHSCGSIFDLLPDLIDSGVDIINPIQPGARKMEPERLKAKYGDAICFHGGFDTQRVLPFGTAENIIAEVERVMAALKPDGGYIFSAAHNIQHDVPAENVLTMFQAARRLGVYDHT